MSTKLTLTIDEEVIQTAKEYAKMKGHSLSELVENYFKWITGPQPNKTERHLSPKIEKLKGVIKMKEEFDYQKILTEELSQKYDL